MRRLWEWGGRRVFLFSSELEQATDGGWYIPSSGWNLALYKSIKRHWGICYIDSFHAKREFSSLKYDKFQCQYSSIFQAGHFILLAVVNVVVVVCPFVHYVLFFFNISCLIRLFGRLHTLIRSVLVCVYKQAQRIEIDTGAATVGHTVVYVRCCSSRSVLVEESRRCNRKPPDFEDLGIKIDLLRGYEGKKEKRRNDINTGKNKRNRNTKKNLRKKIRNKETNDVEGGRFFFN